MVTQPLSVLKLISITLCLLTPVLAVADDASVVNPLGLAEYCIGAMAKFRSTGDTAALARARANADSLLSSVYFDADGRSGWGYKRVSNEKTAKCGAAGSVDAFNDGTCNPPETPYMIQTGYAISCLSQVAIATGEARYLSAAAKAAEDSWNIGATVDGCVNCWSYWYSYHKNDEGRFVRNTNIIMGEGLAWLYVATGDEKYSQRSLQTANEEVFELRNSNWGYLGLSDVTYKKNPKVQADLIENHIPHQIKALKDITLLLKRPEIADYAAKYLDIFMNCDNKRCREGGCSSWAAPPACKGTMTVAPCILSDSVPAFRESCSKAKEALGAFSPFQDYLSEKEGSIMEFAARARQRPSK